MLGDTEEARRARRGSIPLKGELNVGNRPAPRRDIDALERRVAELEAKELGREKDLSEALELARRVSSAVGACARADHPAIREGRELVAALLKLRDRARGAS